MGASHMTVNHLLPNYERVLKYVLIYALWNGRIDEIRPLIYWKLDKVIFHPSWNLLWLGCFLAEDAVHGGPADTITNLSSTSARETTGLQ